MKTICTLFTLQLCFALLAQNASLLSFEAPTCAGGNDGSVVVQTEEFWVTYELIGSDGTEIGLSEGDPFQLTNLYADTYQLKIFGSDLLDSVGNSFSFQIIDPAPIEIVANIENACGETPGSIELIANGGAPPYYFEWEDGSTSSVLNQISCGNYSCIVKDSEDCLYSDTYQVSDILNLSDMDDTKLDFTEGILTISCVQECLKNISVYSISGKELYHQEQFEDCHHQNIDLTRFSEKTLIIQANSSIFKILSTL